MHFEENYEYKIYLRLCPTDIAHSKQITISFEQKAVTAADMWIFFISVLHNMVLQR
jgi:hypothetical protein